MERRSKYNAKRVTVDGITFDSYAEANRYGQLVLLQRDGKISNLIIHPRYELQPSFFCHGKRETAICYEGDFEYIEEGRVVVEDVKGVQTPLFRLKRKMFLFKRPDIDFRIVEAK